MLAIGALAYATGPEFVKYMPEFHKYLETGLQISVHIKYAVFLWVCLRTSVMPWMTRYSLTVICIMSTLLKFLSSPELDRSVKPPILSCIGDIALTIGEHFDKYVPYTLPMLQGAAELCSLMELPDDDSTEYKNELRRSIFEAYSGILQGVRSSKSELMVPYAGHIFQFAELVLRETSKDEGLTKAGVALVGDLMDALGPSIKLLLKNSNFHPELLGCCSQSDDEQLRETASWVQGVISRVLVYDGKLLQ
ncbi:importin subunit beta-1-like [Triticum dicoccoides]|uniref:importin subunit beta-1-like n=1 Tax=Triticum dicoccoides TaxID=85692 RepID=UPI00188E115D|nr:importin subunit beta-1-like [Triticum dicoccoides]